MKEQEIRQSLPSKLQQFRKSAGLTTKEVGELIGKSYKTVSGWEHGRGQPDADMLFRLSKIYGISSMSEFYSDNSGDMTVSEKESEEVLIHLYRSLNNTGKTALITTARAFAGNPDMQKGE